MDGCILGERVRRPPREGFRGYRRSRVCSLGISRPRSQSPRLFIFKPSSKNLLSSEGNEEAIEAIGVESEKLTYLSAIEGVLNSLNKRYLFYSHQS